MNSVAATALLWMFTLAGCASTPQDSSYASALNAYNTHRYSTAHAHAVRAMRSGSADQREYAAYLAGLSAYLLGNVEEAELRLSLASKATDRQVAANAKAMLGQVRLDQNRLDEAARLFDEAATALNGDDAKQAQRYASIARGHADGGFDQQRRTHRSSTGTGGFTLQVGAFQERNRAERAADDAAAFALQAGLGTVNVVPHTDGRGRMLYLVQIGRFTTRSAASSARSRLGRLEYIVASVASP